MSQAAANGVVDELSGAFARARGLLSNLLDLLTLEARRAALAALAFANLAAAAALFWLCAVASRSLLFSGTRRQLRAKRLELV